MYSRATTSAIALRCFLPVFFCAVDISDLELDSVLFFDLDPLRLSEWLGCLLAVVVVGLA